MVAVVVGLVTVVIPSGLHFGGDPHGVEEGILDEDRWNVVPRSEHRHPHAFAVAIVTLLLLFLNQRWVELSNGRNMGGTRGLESIRDAECCRGKSQNFVGRNSENNNNARRRLREQSAGYIMEKNCI